LHKLPVLFLTDPWAKDDSGHFFKAALLSGPPGVGKYHFGFIVSAAWGRGHIIS
jgi:hypothetical protein